MKIERRKREKASRNFPTPKRKSKEGKETRTNTK
jgi:hypothetical protein